MKMAVYVDGKELKKALKRGKSCFLNCDLEMNIKHDKKIKVDVKNLNSRNEWDLRIWLELED